MKALWLENRSLRVRRDVPDPRPGPGEALIRVLQAGVCNTDIELVRGYYPFAGVPGHEFVGDVAEAATRPDLVGMRVVGEINVTCGSCRACLAGRRTHCERRQVLGIHGRNGAFAEYLALPAENLHEVAASISNDEAVFTEPLAAALEIRQQVGIGPGKRVLVLGAGKLGSLVAQVVGLAGCELTVAGRQASAPPHLAGLGIEVVAAHDVPSGSIDVVIECTGNHEGLDAALRLVRPRGTVVLKSTYAGTSSIDMSRVVVNEITLVGSRCGPFPEALELLARRHVAVDGMIAARYGLDSAVAALEEAAKPGTLKVLVAP